MYCLKEIKTTIHLLTESKTLSHFGLKVDLACRLPSFYIHQIQSVSNKARNTDHQLQERKGTFLMTKCYYVTLQ